VAGSLASVSGAEPEALAYASRFGAYGDVLSDRGFQAVDELFAFNQSLGVSLLDGYWFGRDVNLATGNYRVLELSGSGADLIVDHASPQDFVVVNGMANLSGDLVEETLLTTEDGSSIATVDDWTMLLVWQRPDVAADPAHTTIVFAQETSGGSPGHFNLHADWAAGVTLVVRGVMPGTVAIEGPSIGRIAKDALWIEKSGTVMSCYRGYDNSFIGSVDLEAQPAQVPTEIGGLARVALPPRNISYGMIMKFGGVLSTADRASISTKYGELAARFETNVLIIGNSVTAGSGASDFSKRWPKVFARWGTRNGVFSFVSAAGGRTIHSFVPTDYTPLPGEPWTHSIDGDLAIENFVGKRIHWVVFDENQNTVFQVADASYAEYKHALEAIVDHLRVNDNSEVDVIVGTQLAIAGDSHPLGAFGGAASRQQLIDWSASTRSDFHFAEIFEPFDISGVSGFDAPDGDPALYPVDDQQHPNDAGHLLLFVQYRDALLAVVDTDRDGMSNGWEEGNGLDSAFKDDHLDGDGDSATNGEEFIAGTDPGDASSVFSAIGVAVNSNPNVLTWSSVAGREYSIQKSAEGLTSWVTIGSRTATGAVSFFDIADSGSMREYYRVVVVRP